MTQYKAAMLRIFGDGATKTGTTTATSSSTSQFADSAKSYVKSITKKVILIDGAQLASYMIEYGLGVNTATIYEIKKIDNDYFEE